MYRDFLTPFFHLVYLPTARIAVGPEWLVLSKSDLPPSDAFRTVSNVLTHEDTYVI